MNVALMGGVSSTYSCLDALIRGGVEITGVLGLDDSHAANVCDFRSLRPLAQPADLPFHAFTRVDEPGVETFLRRCAPDLLWVIGLSQLVPRSVVALARCGAVGFHPTMLPQGRGRAPVAWTILKQERAAVTLFHLVDEPDAGDIIAQREVPVLADDYSEDLIARTNEVLTEVVLDLSPAIRSGILSRTPQDPAQATVYPKRTPADGLIDWSQSTEQLYRLVRAAGRPYPGAFTFADGRKVTVWRARPARGAELETRWDAAPYGRILRLEETGRALVKTGDGALWLTETQVDPTNGPPPSLAVGVQLKQS